MLSAIELQHFKCFERLRLPLQRLTLLSGTNASGKSTILQALVLLHQTMFEQEWSTRLQLNGSVLRLGTLKDVADKVHGHYEFKIAVHDETCSMEWTCGNGEERDSMSAPVIAVRIDGQAALCPERLRFLTLETSLPGVALARRLRGLTYLTAERVGPRDFYELRDGGEVEVVGPRGENAVGLLFRNRDRHVASSLILESEPPTLLKQVQARMQTFFPGMSLAVQQVAQTNLVTLGLRTSAQTDFHRPVHVGFGLTQVLPIVVAVLAAREGDLFLIENPEVHLHPSGQALMGQFLADAARAGVQVLLESHSDHVLNGIRRSVKAGVLSPNEVVLHFFSARGQTEAQVTTPLLDGEGNIDDWPSGFFDQFDKDLNHFAGWGD